MRIGLIAAGVAGLAVAGAAVASAVSTGSEGSEGRADTAGAGAAAKQAQRVVIPVRVDIVQQEIEGDELGDRQVFALDVFRRGRRVGSAEAVCTVARTFADGFRNQCVGTLRLPKGELVVQTGLRIRLGEGEEIEIVNPRPAAIVGGNGRFRRAGGQAFGRPGPGESFLLEVVVQRL